MPRCSWPAGRGALGEADTAFPSGSFLQAFFFSVETFATIGYGAIVPETVRANFLVLLESFVSLISIALATGLIFARFSRPIPRIRFSARALIAPYMGRTGFMFRIANARRNEIFGIEATVNFARFVTTNGVRARAFTELALERKRVIFFSLSWTVVHPINETSPLWGMTASDFVDSEAEFLILLSGTDETFFQTVSARGSYTAAELLWGHKFTNIFCRPPPMASSASTCGSLTAPSQLSCRRSLRSRSGYPRTPICSWTCLRNSCGLSINWIGSGVPPVPRTMMLPNPRIRPMIV